MEKPYLLSTDGLLILFGGKGREHTVLGLHKKGYKILSVVVPAQVSPGLQESITELQKWGLNVIYCAKNELDVILKPFAGCVLLSVGFPYLLQQPLLSLFKLCLNVHPTLLPQYRGPTSLAYVFINHERETGSTVHLIDSGMDTGSIVLQKKIPITLFDTLRSIQRKLYEMEPDLVSDAFLLLKTPGFAPIMQDETKASIYSKRRIPADSIVDPSKSLLDLYDEIRACDPNDFPAYFIVDGQKVCIKLWRPNRPVEDSEDML
jgi:methionyl-tRNA formyltransferase